MCVCARMYVYIYPVGNKIGEKIRTDIFYVLITHIPPDLIPIIVERLERLWVG